MFSEDTEGGKRKREKKKKGSDLIKRMVDSYRKRKRKEKISKLQGSDSHWPGLQ